MFLAAESSSQPVGRVLDTAWGPIPWVMRLGRDGGGVRRRRSAGPAQRGTRGKPRAALRDSLSAIAANGGTVAGKVRGVDRMSRGGQLSYDARTEAAQAECRGFKSLRPLSSRFVTFRVVASPCTVYMGFRRGWPSNRRRCDASCRALGTTVRRPEASSVSPVACYLGRNSRSKTPPAGAVPRAV